MADYADLEIGLHAREGNSWRAELRFSQPGSDADIRFDARGPVVHLDPDQLRTLVNEEEYGRALGVALLGGSVGDGYRQAKAAAQSKGITMRVRLLIGPSAAPLHGLRWESMRDPGDGSPLLTDEAIVFSRYLSSLDWRPVGLRAKSGLRALVAVSGPTDVEDFGADRRLAPVDVAAESARAREALAPLQVQSLSEPGEATLDRLSAELREGFDILYLICHGYLAAGDEPILLLEDEAGKGVPVRAIELVERIRDLRTMPRLVVLASCQSGGGGTDSYSEDGGVLASLGPRLAEAGVPAVVAMQGNVSMATASRFMPVFFRELLRDGQIDRAMAAARGAVRDRSDWWSPVLFMRLRTGRIWYAPGFGRVSDFEKFPALVNEIRKRRCTPVLGPGLNDQLLGSRQEIAQRWAKNFHFPMSPHAREDLPQVAQYLSVNLSATFPRDELGNYLRAALVADYGDGLPTDWKSRAPEDIPLGPLMSHAWRSRYPDADDDPYTVLAQLPMSLYVTTQPWNLLAEALRDAGKDPQVEPCQWKRLDEGAFWDADPAVDSPDWAFQVPDDSDDRASIEQAGWPTSVFDRDRAYRPSTERPMVYHLFGHHARPRSVVITEDDYFDFLIGVTREKDLVPVSVRRAFADSSLMFLGFRLDEWDFRVLFRSIVNQEGNRRSEHPHVAVQIDPEEGRSMEPERARRYLDKYFQSSNVTIYWGSTESFLKELRDAWTRDP